MSMNPEQSMTDEDALRQDLREARERIDGLVGELRAVDEELESVETERQNYRLVQDACTALDRLDEAGASELFWGGFEAVRDRAPSSDYPDGGGAADCGIGVRHLRLVRGRVDEFDKRIDEIDERRQTILDEIQLQEDTADFIAGSVLEAERLEEQKLLEWQIEREVESLQVRVATMPWARGGDDDQRFRRSLAASLLLALLLGFVLPMIEIPIPERWQVLEEQDRLTQLIREELPVPPPAVEIATPEPVAQEELTPEESESPRAAEEVVAEAAPAKTAAEKPSPESKGILAFREKFSSLAEVDSVDRLGSNARISNPGELASGLPQRSMVTSQAASSSGGINIAALSRDTGGSGQQLGGVAVTQATSTIGTGGGTDRPLAGGGPGLGRTDEEIQIVFDRHKAALYRLYNRALRKNPTLRGQMVLRLTIEPDGSVSMCELKSTDMKAPDLSKQVVSRVGTFDFGAKEGISAVTIIYPIDFLPAT